MSRGGNDSAGHTLYLCDVWRTKLWQRNYRKVVSAPGLLNRGDLAHASPFTLPGGHSLDPYTLDGQPECLSALDTAVVLSPEDHVEAFAIFYKQ